MDPATLAEVAASATALTALIRQIRIGMRDRSDRKALANSPYIAAALIELRKPAWLKWREKRKKKSG